jgi:putative ABC transport system permease protein
MREPIHDWRADVRARLRSARLHPQDEAGIVDEVAQHLEAQFAELAPTLGAAAARARLLAELDEQGFDEAAAPRRRRTRPAPTRVWGAGSLWRDVRYGVRSLRRSPAMVVAGTLALALGIGLTTMMFSIIYGMLIKGLPFDDAPRIAVIKYADPANSDEDTAIPLGDFVRFRARQRSFETVGGYSLGTATVSGGDRPDRVLAARVTAGALDVTRVRAMLGRTFTLADDDPAAPPTAVIGYPMWRDRYASDSAVVGKVVRVDGRPHTIVGVMPERFDFPRAEQIWIALQRDVATLRPGEGTALSVVGRLRPGVAYERASAELSGIVRQLAAERVPAVELHGIAMPFVRAMMPGRVYTLFYAMLGAVMLVLVVACANVANLLLDRAVSRTREIGIRTSLGASRLAVIRQSLVESTLLAMLAAVVGTGVAQAGIVAFNRAMADNEHPFWMDIRLHPPVLAFVLGVAMLASLVSGILPALQSARLDVSATLKDDSLAVSGRRVGRLSRMIVGVEIALSTAMLVAAGFMTKSIVKLRAVEPGFTTAGVYTARVSPSSTDPAAQRRFLEALEQRLGALPGAAGAYVGAELPGSGWSGEALAIEGRTYAREHDRPTVRALAVSPGFFATFGVRVLRGRAIAPSDGAGSPRVAVISESFARRHLAGMDPIGRRIRLGGSDSDVRSSAPSPDGEWATIVGVVPTMFALSMRNPWPAEVLTAFWQGDSWPSASVALRGPPDVASAAPIRRLVAALDPEVPLYTAASMDDVLSKQVWIFHVLGTMFVIFGVTSLALAAIGLYAVMAFSVSRRTRELGIRIALGASSSSVIRMVCEQGAAQVTLGIAAGFLAGAGIVRIARAVLFEVQPNDLAVFAVVAGVLGAAALVACVIPAIRATRVDPLVALRAE